MSKNKQIIDKSFYNNYELFKNRLKRPKYTHLHTFLWQVHSMAYASSGIAIDIMLWCRENQIWNDSKIPMNNISSFAHSMSSKVFMILFIFHYFFLFYSIDIQWWSRVIWIFIRLFIQYRIIDKQAISLHWQLNLRTINGFGTFQKINTSLVC